MFVLAYAFLTTYQAYYLLDKIGSAEADVPQQIFLGTLVQSVVVVIASPLGGRLSDRTGRRKVFVLAASTVYGLAMFTIAVASGFNGFLVGMAIAGLGFGMYMAVDLALVADVLPDTGPRRAGPRRPQHRRRPALVDRAGDRTGDPGDRRRQLWGALRRRRRVRSPRSRRHPAGEGRPLTDRSGGRMPSPRPSTAASGRRPLARAADRALRPA